LQIKFDEKRSFSRWPLPTIDRRKARTLLREAEQKLHSVNREDFLTD